MNSGPEGARRTVRFCVRGRVQGVGFRAFVESHASQLAVDGWVRNRRNGTVEGILKGRADDITTLIDRCRQGPAGALVTSVQAQDVEDDVGSGFAVWPTA